MADTTASPRQSVFALEGTLSAKLATLTSVGRLVKGLAVAGRREEVTPIETNSHIRVREDVGASDDGRINFASP